MEYIQEVRNQYENYPYPYRDPEDEKTRLIYTLDAFLEKINHFCYQGKQTFNNFRALVAGGGTGSAAIFLAEQLRHKKNAEIVYLDISRQSMDIAQKRATIRGLKNITWIHNSILNLPDLDLGTFDYINCVGVLHHHRTASHVCNQAGQHKAVEEGAIGVDQTSVCPPTGCI